MRMHEMFYSGLWGYNGNVINHGMYSNQQQLLRVGLHRYHLFAVAAIFPGLVGDENDEKLTCPN